MATERNDWNGAQEQNPPGVNDHSAPADEEIAQRACELYLARGGAHGYDLEDWLEARRQLEDPGDRDSIAHS
jgi:hypothetical protein